VKKGLTRRGIPRSSAFLSILPDGLLDLREQMGRTGSIWWAGLCMLGDLLQELGPGFAEASNLQGMPVP